MSRRQPVLPALWLLSDSRSDARLDAALTALARGSAMVFRHYHLTPELRRARFARLRRLAHARGHLAFLAGDPSLARAWRADGVYGAPARLRARSRDLSAVATAHSLAEIARARRAGVDAVMLSPVFATRSHPGARTLGPVRFRLLAARAGLPVIALGGMDLRRAERRLRWRCWAAVDGLSAA